MNYVLALWYMYFHIDLIHSDIYFNYFSNIQYFSYFPTNMKISFIHLIFMMALFLLLILKEINNKTGFIGEKISNSNLSQALSRVVSYKDIELKYYQVLLLGSFLIYFVGLQFESDLYILYGKWYMVAMLVLIITHYMLLRKFLAVNFFRDISAILDKIFLISSFFLVFSFLSNTDNEGFILFGMLLISLSLLISILRFEYKRRGILDDLEFIEKDRANYPLISMLFLFLLQLLSILLTYLEFTEGPQYTGNIYVELLSYFLSATIFIGLIEFIANKMEIDQLKSYFKYTVIIAMLLFLSVMIVDDFYFAVGRWFDGFPILGTYVFLILPTGVATGFEMAIIKRKKEL